MAEKKFSLIDYDERPRETIAYAQWREYESKFLIPSNVDASLNQYRDFFYGKQYDFTYASSTPKPVFNLCKEGAERITAKITGTKRHISFVADKEDETLNMMDNFYEFQMSEMDDDTITDSVTIRGIVDGTGVCFTTFDEDTIGTEGLYKGFLKRSIVPFEHTFWSNPWTNDPQDQRYLGYWINMEVSAVRSLVEGDSEEEIEWKKRHVCAEGFFDKTAPYDFDQIADSDMTRVFVRFFRVDGEVYFELSTEYVTLTSHPHALNPKLNERSIYKAMEGYEKRVSGDTKEGRDDSVSVDDYDTDVARYALFTKPVSQTHEGHVSAKDKFSRYPVSVFTPYPVDGCILGQSFVSFIIPNQKIVNYFFLSVALIAQNHAMPKILVKPGALGNQQYDNTPNQVVTDYTSVSELGGNGWGITRLGSGDAVNSNLIEIGSNIINLTRKIYGFDNLDAEKYASDISGYAYSQMVRQINLTLEIPQRRLWEYVKNNARTDLMYFKHYVDQAKYFEVRSDSQIELNENYRQMEQSLIDSGKSSIYQKGQVLPKTRRYEMHSLKNGFFDDEFNITLEVEQGIAGSELTESQHFNQLMQYVAQGNISADMLKVLVTNDPALSSKTRAKMKASIESLENSQLAVKDQQIQQLQEAISQLEQYMKFSQQVIKQQQLKQKATEQAAADQNKVAAQLIKSNASGAGGTLSESEVKSNNAKGISGTSFTKPSVENAVVSASDSSGVDNNQSIYNTGA